MLAEERLEGAQPFEQGDRAQMLKSEDAFVRNNLRRQQLALTRIRRTNLGAEPRQDRKEIPTRATNARGRRGNAVVSTLRRPEAIQAPSLRSATKQAGLCEETYGA